MVEKRGVCCSSFSLDVVVAVDESEFAFTFFPIFPLLKLSERASKRKKGIRERKQHKSKRSHLSFFRGDIERQVLRRLPVRAFETELCSDLRSQEKNQHHRPSDVLFFLPFEIETLSSGVPHGNASRRNGFFQ